MIRNVLVVLLVITACTSDGDASSPLAGEELAAEVGCLACHTDSDTSTAPTLDGIWGTEDELADGRTVTVDEEYVRRSITEPQAEAVEGYNTIMPTFPLDDDEVDHLVEWVRSMG